MIIRRRHTAHYTTIGNILFDDERLAADEVGILAFLLSRPHDWEVRRPALMRRWKVGRDTIKRVMTNLIRTGWCRARKIRLSNGTFQIIYEIRDEPGRELTEDEVVEALSVVSTDACGDESGGEDAADQPRTGPPGTGPPPTGQPGVADQGVVTPPLVIEDLQSTRSPRTESTQCGWDFSDAKAIWPVEHVLSYVVCESLHVGLTDRLQEAAVSGMRPYLDDCTRQNRKVCDLATYYRERRWERFAAGTPAKPTFFALKRGIPQTFRWREYYERAEPHKLAGFDWMMAQYGTYTVPSEWPPHLPPKADSETGPSSDRLSDEDTRVLAGDL